MLDIAIVGGGVCGLALARELQQQGLRPMVFEARSRLGGRVLSKPSNDGRTRVDLGPTWFWPQSQPLLTQLTTDLGLQHFAQHDSGAVLALKDPDKSPEVASAASLHDGARRLANGMMSLVEALAQSLPPEQFHLDHALSAVLHKHDHVELHFVHGDALIVERARRVVLAMPPRLIHEQVRFEPALDTTMQEALQITPTWMAAQAKVVILYQQASWRSAGQSGNAFVQHEQAVLKEIFDACDGNSAALGGFVALSPALRRSFHVGLPLLLGNQMSQVFGAELEELEQHYCDWANELYTCSTLDLAEGNDHAGTGAAHPQYTDPLLRQSLWEQRLLFGGSETSAYGNGYLEGALEAARRLRRELASFRVAILAGESRNESGIAVRNTRTMPAVNELNAHSLAQFRQWVLSRQEAVFETYRQLINRSLAVQQREQLTQRAMLGAMEQVFSDALCELENLPFDAAGVAIERGRSTLTPEVQAAFNGFIQSLLDAVVSFNRTSCALSNFPDEHRLSRDYEQTILRDIAAAWREFSLNANRVLIGKGVPTAGVVPFVKPVSSIQAT